MLVILICKMLLINFYDFDIFFSFFFLRKKPCSIVVALRFLLFYMRKFDVLIFLIRVSGVLGLYLCSLNEIVSTTWYNFWIYQFLDAWYMHIRNLILWIHATDRFFLQEHCWAAQPLKWGILYCTITKRTRLF